MRKLILIFATVLIYSPYVAHSQDLYFSSTSFQNSIQTAVNDNDFAKLNSIINLECGKFIESSRLIRNTVDIREDSASKALECITIAKSYSLSSTSNFEKRARLTEFYTPLLESSEKRLEKAKADSSFLGLNWGVGFGYSFGFDDNIDDAEIVNGIVRVKSSKQDQPRALLEFHKYF